MGPETQRGTITRPMMAQRVSGKLRTGNQVFLIPRSIPQVASFQSHRPAFPDQIYSTPIDLGASPADQRISFNRNQVVCFVCFFFLKTHCFISFLLRAFVLTFFSLANRDPICADNILQELSSLMDVAL